LDNSIGSNDVREADNESSMKQDIPIDKSESTMQRDVSDTPNDPQLIWPTQKLKIIV
jgi:hypothetical protein